MPKAFKEQNVVTFRWVLWIDNVVESLGGMPWYEGQTILEHLKLWASRCIRKGKARFQYKPLDQKQKNTMILEAMLENYKTILKLEMP
jgi:sulfate adenylyltransferase subunit 1 (EFTu-like GTPase family)